MIDLVVRDPVVRHCGVVPRRAVGTRLANRPGDSDHHVVDIVVQHLAVAAAQLHRHGRLDGRDLEALNADVTGLKVKSAHDSRPPGHCPQRDRLARHAARSDHDPLIVLARHDKDSVARLDHVGGMPDGFEGPFLRARVGVRRARCCLVHHVSCRTCLPGCTHCQGHPERNQAHSHDHLLHWDHCHSSFSPLPTEASPQTDK